MEPEAPFGTSEGSAELGILRARAMFEHRGGTLPGMKIAILDDYFDTLRTLRCFRKLDGHDVTISNDHVDDLDVLADRLRDAEALVLIRERTTISAALLERLQRLRLISLRRCTRTSMWKRVTRLGIVVSSELHADAPSYATAELTWGLVLAAMRQIPQQVAALQSGTWQTGVGRTLRGLRLGIYGTAESGRLWRATGGRLA